MKRNLQSMIATAGWVLMIAIAVLPLGAETSKIPADVIQTVVEGIKADAVTLERVSPEMKAPDAKVLGKMLSLADGKPEELLKISEKFQNLLILTTNTIRILTRTPDVGLVEQSFSSADRTNISRGRYGWTPHFAWTHDDGESMAWVVPIAELQHQKEIRAESILKSNHASRIAHENLLQNLGLVWLGGAQIRYDAKQGLFVATLGNHAALKFKTNEVILHPHWSNQQLELTYEFPRDESRRYGTITPLPERYRAQLNFMTSPEGRQVLESVRTYSVPNFQATPDPQALVEAIQFRDMGPNRVSEEDARVPMQHLNWKEWLEFLNGRWVIRNRDGSTTDLPEWDKPSWNLESKAILLLWIFSGLICLLLAGALGKKMAKSGYQTKKTT